MDSRLILHIGPWLELFGVSFDHFLTWKKKFEIIWNAFIVSLNHRFSPLLIFSWHWAFLRRIAWAWLDWLTGSEMQSEDMQDHGSIISMDRRLNSFRSDSSSRNKPIFRMSYKPTKKYRYSLNFEVLIPLPQNNVLVQKNFLCLKNKITIYHEKKHHQSRL